MPLKTITVESCLIKIVDSSNHPLNDATVVQYWRYYGLESAEHEETKMTDQEGLVTFPSRSFYASPLSRAFHMIGNLDTGVHSSWGPSVSFIVDHPGYKRGWLATVITGSEDTFKALKRGDTATITLEPESKVQAPVAEPSESSGQINALENL